MDLHFWQSIKRQIKQKAQFSFNFLTDYYIVVQCAYTHCASIRDNSWHLWHMLMLCVKTQKVSLTSRLSMFFDLTSLTPFFFSSVFKKMITMVTRSSAPVCSDADESQGQPSQMRVECRQCIWAKPTTGWWPPICRAALKR